MNQVSIFNEEEQNAILKKRVELYKPYSKYFRNTNAHNILGKCQMLDFKEPMVEDLLMKIDKNTMAFSIEARVPFLDYRIVELAAKIPDNFKLKGVFRDKHILREAVKNIIPAETKKRKKRHFFVPIENWLSNLDSVKDELLSENYVRKQGIFQYDYIKKMNSNFYKSRLFYSRQLWSLLTFQIWYKQYIENEKVTI